MGATIQDGGTRERRDGNLLCCQAQCYKTKVWTDFGCQDH